MVKIERLKLQPDKRMVFFKSFLKRPGRVGYIVPSSRFLERRLVQVTGARHARLIVEFGPGTGGTTRAMLNEMPRDSKLLAVEIDPEFVRVLKRWNDPRLIVHQGDARTLGSILETHGLDRPDVVFSGIPFSTMPRPIGHDIIRTVYEHLTPGGLFVAYQMRNVVASLGREVFGRPRAELEILNVPPMRLYSWRKPTSEGVPGRVRTVNPAPEQAIP